MAGRALRSLPLVQSWAELSTLDHPQWVNEDGLEVEEPPAGQSSGDADAAQETEEGAMDIDEPEEVLVTPEEGEAEPQEPLLSLKESQIFPYALLQTRQHHIQHLLPHIFSHPPIPSHNKPRARGPPKGTFLFPTPPPLIHPLPIPEYHAGRSSHTAQSAESSGAPTPGPESPASPAPSAPVTAKQSKKAARENMDGPPAHEMDCIARVTLSIGPISFPATELWVGRFVEPRAKPHKMRRPKGEAKEKKRSLAEDAALRRARIGSTGASSSQFPIRPPPVNPLGPRPSFGPAAPPLRPRPPPNTASGPSPATSSPPKTNILVNKAAGRHPWLLTIIHKAARSLASKEELSKLGRVVARLSRGEDVGEGPLDGLTPAASTSTSASSSSAAIAGPSNPPATSAPATAPTKSPAPAADDPDSSDSEVDMKGTPQVGGGPLPLIDSAAHPPPPRESSVDSSLSSAPSTPHTGPLPLPQHPPAALPTSSGTPRPPGFVPSVLLPPKSTAPSPLASLGTRPPPPLGSFPPGYLPPKPTSVPPPPLIPPKPQYPTLPRFLLVAFKEARTEKYMLPLGRNSYVSRVGGDYVSDPPPPIVLPVPTPNGVSAAPPPSSSAAAAPASAPAPRPEAASSAESGKRRTRQSLAGDTPAPKPELAPVVEPKLEAEPQIETKKAPPSSTLPPLPGGIPPKGTVLISTFVPVNEWLKPDWETVEKGLPWLNTALMRPPPPKAPEVKPEPPKSPEAPATPLPGTAPSAPTNAPSSPTRSLRHPPRLSESAPEPRKKIPQDAKPKVKVDRLLNFGAHDFLPEDPEALHPVTIRLEGIDDATWRKMKIIMEEIEGFELKHLALDEPEVLANVPSATVNPADPAVSSTTTPTIPNTTLSRAPMLAASRLGLTIPQVDALRKRLRQLRKSTFNNLLARVPDRSFLRNRVESSDPAIADALADKWAPRPYPISTKPLYATNAAGEEDFESAPVYLSPEKPTKRRKGEEETVTFEMPVSLDALDEMVEEGARLSMNTGRGRGRGGRGGKVDDGRKRHGKRWTPGAICEGCGLAKKVWRHGPNGRRTLCNACGDAYTEGTLGPLKAPGASSQNANVEGDESMEGMEVDPPETKPALQEDPAVGPNTAEGIPEAPAVGKSGIENDLSSHPPAQTIAAPTEGEAEPLQGSGTESDTIAVPDTTNVGRTQPTGDLHPVA